MSETAFEDVLERAARGELLTPHDMQVVFKIGHARFAQLRAAGKFEVFKVKPAIGRACYSGVLVYRYLKNEPLYEPSFGRQVKHG